MHLENIRIGTPCGASWEAMSGDDRVRFCGGCRKNVYNLSAMTRGEAEALITEREGPMCVRLYLREDGTVMTSDCPVGLRRLRVRRVMAAVVGAGAMALAANAMAYKRGAPPVSETPAEEITMAPEVSVPVPGPVLGPAPPAMEQPDYETRPPPPRPQSRRLPVATKEKPIRMLMGDMP